MVRQFTERGGRYCRLYIEEYLERRADEPPSVIREFSFAADVVDDMESQNS